MSSNLILAKAQELEGLTFAQLGHQLNLPIPATSTQAKGWLGQAVEKFLGATAGCLPIPDFPNLNLEIKTIPINGLGKVLESTYVTVLPLREPFYLEWRSSSCYRKLQHVLWVVVEGEQAIPYPQRRISRAITWKPTIAQEEILKADFELIMDMVIHGRIEEISGSLGCYLHIRPKAANASALTAAMNTDGESIQTLPRGFYLRSHFTQEILQMACEKI